MSDARQTYLKQAVRLLHGDPALAEDDVVRVARARRIAQLQFQWLLDEFAEGAVAADDEEIALLPRYGDELMLLIRVQFGHLVRHHRNAGVRTVIQLFSLVLRHRHNKTPEIALVQVQIAFVAKPHGCPGKPQTPDTLLLYGAVEADTATRLLLVVQQLVVDVERTLANRPNGNEGPSDAGLILLLLVAGPQLHLQHFLYK